GRAYSRARVAISCAIASMAASASGPLAVTRMEQPGLAASIMRPMIDVPPTLMPSFSTEMVARNESASCTNLADALACSPRWLTIGRSRAIAPSVSGPSTPLIRRRSFGRQQLAGYVDVFAAGGLRFLDRDGEL